MSNISLDAAPRGWTRYDFFKLAERIPVISTVTSVATLAFQKKNDLPIGPSDYSFSQYGYETPGIRSFTLLIPVLGNIIVALYDLINAKYDDEEYMLEEIKADVQKAYDASPRLLNDIRFLYKACAANPNLLDYGSSHKLRANREWMLKFVTEHPEYTSKATPSLLNDKTYIEKALEIGTDPYISNHIGYRLLDDRDIMIKAMKHADPLIIDRIQGDLRDDLEFQRELVRINPKAYLEAEGQGWSSSMEGLKIILKTDPEVVKGREEEIRSARIDELPILDDAQIVREIFMNKEIKEEVRDKILFTYLRNHPCETPDSAALLEIIEMAVKHCNNLKGLYYNISSHPYVMDNVKLAIKAVKRDPECFEYSYSTRHYKEVQRALKIHHPEYYYENRVAEKYPVRDTKYGGATAAPIVNEEEIEELFQRSRR